MESLSFVLGNELWLTLLEQGSWTGWSPEVPSNLNDSPALYVITLSIHTKCLHYSNTNWNLQSCWAFSPEEQQKNPMLKIQVVFGSAPQPELRNKPVTDKRKVLQHIYQFSPTSTPSSPGIIPLAVLSGSKFSLLQFIHSKNEITISAQNKKNQLIPKLKYSTPPAAKQSHGSICADSPNIQDLYSSGLFNI